MWATIRYLGIGLENEKKRREPHSCRVPGSDGGCRMLFRNIAFPGPPLRVKVSVFQVT